MDPFLLTPEQFEQDVREILDQESVGLKDYSSSHLEKIKGTDGDYIFDVIASFTALGSGFKVLIECKRQKDPIEREIVERLFSRLLSVGAQKGMIFSTSGFRSGAIKYAKVHGIALAQIQDGKTCYFVKGMGTEFPYPEWIPRSTAVLVTVNDDENICYSQLGTPGPIDEEKKSYDFLKEYFQENK